MDRPGHHRFAQQPGCCRILRWEPLLHEVAGCGRWVCTGGTGHTDKFRKTFQITTTDYVITLADNCTFQPGQTTYTAVGNYDFDDDKYCISYPVTAGLNSVSIPKTAVIPDLSNASSSSALAGVHS